MPPTSGLPPHTHTYASPPHTHTPGRRPWQLRLHQGAGQTVQPTCTVVGGGGDGERGAGQTVQPTCTVGGGGDGERGVKRGRGWGAGAAHLGCMPPLTMNPATHAPAPGTTCPPPPYPTPTKALPAASGAVLPCARLQPQAPLSTRQPRRARLGYCHWTARAGTGRSRGEGPGQDRPVGGGGGQREDASPLSCSRIWT